MSFVQGGSCDENTPKDGTSTDLISPAVQLHCIYRPFAARNSLRMKYFGNMKIVNMSFSSTSAIKIVCRETRDMYRPPIPGYMAKSTFVEKHNHDHPTITLSCGRS